MHYINVVKSSNSRKDTPMFSTTEIKVEIKNLKEKVSGQDAITNRAPRILPEQTIKAST